MKKKYENRNELDVSRLIDYGFDFNKGSENITMFTRNSWIVTWYKSKDYVRVENQNKIETIDTKTYFENYELNEMDTAWNIFAELCNNFGLYLEYE